jgi:hypothetical protein
MASVSNEGDPFLPVGLELPRFSSLHKSQMMHSQGRQNSPLMSMSELTLNLKVNGVCDSKRLAGKQ